MLLCTTDFQATYRVVTPFKLPYHSGSLLRGLFGRALRRTGCVRAEGACAGACERPGECHYARLFDPTVPSPSPHRFLHPGAEAPPRVLPLLPPMGGVALAKGDSLSFGARVLGPLDDEAERRLLGALEAIAELPIGTDGGRVELDALTRQGRRNREVGWQAEGAAEQGSMRVRVTFETPAWIEHEKRVVAEVPFRVLFRALYRRVSVLGALYGELGEGHEGAFARLDALASGVRGVGSALRLLRWERLSEERGARHWMRGVTGAAVFEGVLGELMGVLGLGEVVHVGKSTGFGLGRLRVERDGGGR